ncbi:MAG: MFS transporter [Planctomycetota bacterium]
MNLLATSRSRRLLFALLYLCEGAPIGFLWGALPVLLAERGVPDAEVTSLLALVVLPWSLKVFLAPLVDLWQRPHFTLRGWIAAAQLGMVATLVPLLGADLPPTSVLTPFLMLHACAAALQDVAIDNLAIASTAPAERGRTTAAMQAGLLAGRFLFGAVALWISATLGARVLALVLVLLLAAGIGLAFLYSPPPVAAERGGVGFGRALRVSLGRRSVWAAVLFAAVGGTAYEATAGVARVYLSGRGFGAGEIATRFGVPTLFLMAAGAWVGGVLADRRGRVRATVWAGLAVAATVGAVAAAARVESSTPVLVALLVLHAAIGMFTAGSYALFMDLTDPRLAATQFSAFMAATNVCESWSVALCGQWAADSGYPATFARFALLGLLGLLPLWWLRRLRVDRGRDS